jgi:hypothetical protein
MRSIILQVILQGDILPVKKRIIIMELLLNGVLTGKFKNDIKVGYAGASKPIPINSRNFY